MRRLKKIAAGLLAAVLAVGMLTACSDKVTGSAKSWELSNVGKIAGRGDGAYDNYRMLTYKDNGATKYIVRKAENKNGKAFIGTMTKGWLWNNSQLSSGDCFYSYVSNWENRELMNHSSRKYKDETENKRYQGDITEECLWIFMKKESNNWVLAGENSYEGKTYYTEAFRIGHSLSSSGTDWKKIDYVFYYKSKSDTVPAFIRINAEGFAETVVEVVDLQMGGTSEDSLPQTYKKLLTIDNSYTKET